MEVELIEKRIKKEGDQWCVQSKKGKNLGCAASREGAVKRLREVEYFKHTNKSLVDDEDGIWAALEDGSLSVSDEILMAYERWQAAQTRFRQALGWAEGPAALIIPDGNTIPILVDYDLPNVDAEVGLVYPGSTVVIDKHMPTAACPECGSKEVDPHIGRGTHKCAKCGCEYKPHEKHLPGKHDQKDHAGNRATHDEYMKNEKDLSLAKDAKRAYEGDAKHWRKKGQKERAAQYDSLARESEEKVDVLKERQSQLKKSGQYSHPEWGQFTLAERDRERRVYKSPSGDTVEHYYRGRWSMQNVAAHATVESGGGRKEWSGDTAQDSARKFLLEVYGIGQDDPLLRKHLAGKHEQKTHGRPASAGEIKEGLKAKKSSMEAKLKGQELNGKQIKAVRSTGNKKKRLVVFKDGSGAWVPTPVLIKMAYGGSRGMKGTVGEWFKTEKDLHLNGFVSYAQANYLYHNNQSVFWELMESAQEGRRVWNPKTKKFTVYDPELGDEEL